MFKVLEYIFHYHDSIYISFLRIDLSVFEDMVSVDFESNAFGGLRFCGKKVV